MPPPYNYDEGIGWKPNGFLLRQIAGMRFFQDCMPAHHFIHTSGIWYFGCLKSFVHSRKIWIICKILSR